MTTLVTTYKYIPKQSSKKSTVLFLFTYFLKSNNKIKKLKYLA